MCCALRVETVATLRLGAALEPIGDRARRSRDQRLAEHDGSELVRLTENGIALGRDHAPGDKERGTRAAAPLLDPGETVGRLHSRLLGQPRSSSERGREPACLDLEVGAFPLAVGLSLGQRLHTSSRLFAAPLRYRKRIAGADDVVPGLAGAPLVPRLPRRGRLCLRADEILAGRDHGPIGLLARVLRNGTVGWNAKEERLKLAGPQAHPVDPGRELVELGQRRGGLLVRARELAKERDGSPVHYDGVTR